MIKSKIIDYLKKAIRETLTDTDLTQTNTEASPHKSVSSPDWSVFAPENEKFGHYSTNAALKLANLKKKNPLIAAEKIVSSLNKVAPKNFFEKIEITVPGFINFWLSQSVITTELKKIIKLKDDYGRLDNWKGKKVMVEFTDPNPFKEFHIGHLYSNIVGETISKIFEAGGAIVKRANYQGDVGLHVAKSIWGMIKKMKSEGISLSQLEKRTLKHKIKFMSQAYAKGAKAFEKDERVKLEIIDLNKKIFALDKEIKDLYQKGRRWSLDYFEKIYKRLGTKFDFYYFEREVGKSGLKIVKDNLRQGIFEISGGAVVFPGEKYGLHRRVFITKEGLPTYEAKELGLAPTKFKDFPYDLSVIVTGNEIIDYFKVLICALKQINPRLGKKVIHIAHGMVRLAHSKISSRTGNIITGEELLDEAKKRVLKIMTSSKSGIPKAKKKEIAEKVAVGAVKYSFLKVSLGQDIIFDFDKSLSIQGDSGPYLQYTYARLRNVIRKAGGLPKKKDFLLLENESEKSVMRQLIYFTDVLSRATDLRETNIITDYLVKLSNALNGFYESEPILKAPRPLRENRLNLILAATTVLKNGLYLLGIEAPEKM